MAARSGRGTLAPTNPQDPGEGDVRSCDSFQSVLKNNQPKYFNDAFWMDLDYPIVTAKDGTRWKPLFAFTALDLDSRLNLAVAGNFQADYTGQGGLFQKMFKSSTATSEYEKTESLRKVMNNITFTSNAFAVWVTVGFFEVDATNEITQEIGKSENRHVRHRMFAIVDRSQLVLPDQQLTMLAAPSNKFTPAITVAATSGAYASNFDSPMVPAKVDYPNFNMREYTYVVPYYSIID
jgi:hypothetical protein